MTMTLTDIALCSPVMNFRKQQGFTGDFLLAASLKLADGQLFLQRGVRKDESIGQNKRISGV